MTPDHAAFVIQNAWRRFDDDRKEQLLAEYESEMWEAYERKAREREEEEVWSSMYPAPPADYEVDDMIDDYDDYM